jgi:hypothetical protein
MACGSELVAQLTMVRCSSYSVRRVACVGTLAAGLRLRGGSRGCRCRWRRCRRSRVPHPGGQAWPGLTQRQQRQRRRDRRRCGGGGAVEQRRRRRCGGRCCAQRRRRAVVDPEDRAAPRQGSEAASAAGRSGGGGRGAAQVRAVAPAVARGHATHRTRRLLGQRSVRRGGRVAWISRRHVPRLPDR